ncbi:MAG: MbnP family copper-binding protein, partial [Myxococcota bacterium]
MRRLMLGLPALLLLACDPATDDPAPDEVEPLSVDLAFAARVGGAPAACGVEATLGTSDTTGALADARLFLSTIQLRDADSGDWVDIELSESIWQQPGLALLDFEDGTGACADSGTSETNSTITGTVPDATYDAVRFDVGVPFESNHLDSAQAPAPLNAPGMFWAWQSGYKFVRVDWAVTGGE